MQFSYKTTLLATFGFALLTACGHKAEESSNLFPAETIAVKTASIDKTTESADIIATGLVTTEQASKYAFKIGGIIDRVLVDEGQSFRKGQLLATLKQTEIGAQLAQAKLGLEKAQRDHARVKNLYADSVATLEQLQNSQTGLDMAKQAVEAVQFNVQYASIFAETDGFVTKKLAQPGEVIGGGFPVLAINETGGKSGWVLKVGVSDREWASIQMGGTATVTLDAFPNRTFEATVLRKSLAADPNSGSFEIEMKINPEKTQLALGMYGKARIHAETITQQTVIPYDALIEADGNHAFVFVPVPPNSVRKVPVTIARFDKNQVIIASGLEGIQSVVISNSAFLNESSTVTIIQ